MIDVVGLWNKAGLPVLSKQRIEAKLKDLIEKYNTARKKVMKGGGSKVDEGWLYSLFDMCTCKCFITDSPVIHNKKCSCSCEVADRIPVKEIFSCKTKEMIGKCILEFWI